MRLEWLIRRRSSQRLIPDELEEGQKSRPPPDGECVIPTVPLRTLKKAGRPSGMKRTAAALSARRPWLIPLSQAHLYVVPERIWRVEFGHRAALKTRYPVAFRLPSYGGAAYA